MFKLTRRGVWDKSMECWRISFFSFFFLNYLLPVENWALKELHSQSRTQISSTIIDGRLVLDIDEQNVGWEEYLEQFYVAHLSS